MAAVLFAAIVLLSALPWSTLLNQHAQLSSATAELTELQAENRALAAQARQLANISTQDALARQDYGLVHPGQTAYDILPAPGSTPSDSTESGHVPLNEAPVAPGSHRSQELLGVGVVSSTSSGAAAGTASGASRRGAGAGAQGTSPAASLDTGGFWSRVAHTLEFWN